MKYITSVAALAIAMFAVEPAGAEICPVTYNQQNGVHATCSDPQQGPQGEQGVAGIQGEPGAKGDKGDKGDDGAQGIQGVQGIQGEKGDRGEQGLAGTNGTNGVDGKDGLNGADGKDGAQGEKGEKGETGATGAQGAAGKDFDPDDMHRGLATAAALNVPHVEKRFAISPSIGFYDDKAAIGFGAAVRFDNTWQFGGSIATDTDGKNAAGKAVLTGQW